MVEERIIDIAIQRTRFEDGFDVAIFGEEDYGRKHFVVTSLEMVERNELDEVNPLFKLTKTMAQQLFDDLWENGLRPTNNKQDKEDKYVKAIESHLSDIRKLVFKGE